MLNIGIWFYFHQVAPFTFSEQVRRDASNQASKNHSLLQIVPKETTLSPELQEKLLQYAPFQETTTEEGSHLYNKLDTFITDEFSQSKISIYLYENRQDVLNACNRSYYSEFLTGHHLVVTNEVFGMPVEERLSSIYINIQKIKICLLMF